MSSIMDSLGSSAPEERLSSVTNPKASPRWLISLAGAVLLLLGSLLSWCFVKGILGDVSYSFASLHVNGAAAPQFALELQRVLESSGAARIVAAPAEAQALLAITSVVDDKGVLSLSSGGRVREYLLTKRVAFNVRDAEGRDWLPASEFTVRRAYTFNETEVLAREAQEQRLLKEMQTDAVQQIVRRLQAAKKPGA